MSKIKLGYSVKRVRNLFISVGVLFLFISVVLIEIGAEWINRHFSPPSNPLNQRSIATYVLGEMSGGSEPLWQASPEAFSWSKVLQPPKSTEPWTRWWWPGGDIEDGTLASQLDELAAAHFGGVEIQPLLSGMGGVKDDAVLKRVYSFDTPGYYKKLSGAISKAVADGMQVDLTHFSGWPPGGPEVNLEDGLTEIVYAETDVLGGRNIDIDLPKPKPGPSEYLFLANELKGVDFINFPAEHARALSVAAAKQIAGEHSANPFRIDDTVNLDFSSLQVITNGVKGNKLHWAAPDGNWKIIVSYLMPSGEPPMLATQKPQGFVLDHFRKPQVLGHYEYAFGARTGLPEYYGRGFRGFFNDSIEFRARRLSVNDILTEFKNRRGYDLEAYLPAIYVEGFDNVYFRDIIGASAAPDFHLTDSDDRIRYDYQKTLSDIFIERFVETSAQWAQAHGLSSRGQSYGVDIDVIRALGANTIPETEQLWAGGSELSLKLASSASAIYGKPLTSAESFVWINRDYTTTARKIKAAADKLFLSGINHIIYHGTPYRWEGGKPSPFGEEGWAPFSGPSNEMHFSSVVSAANSTLWPDIPAINSYIARCQNLLRQGSPSIDVLIYYPFLGFEAANPDDVANEPLLNGTLPDADPVRISNDLPALAKNRNFINGLIHQPKASTLRAEWTKQMRPLLAEFDRRGISWGWINADAIQRDYIGANTLKASASRYQMLLFPNIDRMDPATLKGLQMLRGQGASIVFAGGMPQKQTGFYEAIRGDLEVKSLGKQLLSEGAKQIPFDSNDVVGAIQAQLDSPIQYKSPSTILAYRRSLSNGIAITFFSNQDARTDTVTLRLKMNRPMWWFDAESGAAWSVSPQNDTIQLRLGGFESRFLVSGMAIPEALQSRLNGSEALQFAQREWPLVEWDFVLGNFRVNANPFFDWRERVEIVHEQGPGTYTATFFLEGKKTASRYLLSLGLVHGSAIVRVNGQSLGRASIPPFIVDATSVLQEGKNQIEVEVLAPLRNLFIGRALHEDVRYAQFKDFQNQPVAAGLMGPVVIAETTP